MSKKINTKLLAEICEVAGAPGCWHYDNNIKPISKPKGGQRKVHRSGCQIQKSTEKSCNIRTDETRKIVQGLGTFTNWKVVSDACTQEHLG